MKIAALLDCPASFNLTYRNGKGFAVAADDPAFNGLVGRARRIVRRYGMARVTQCLPARSKAAEKELDMAKAVLSSESDFRWLAQRSEWFWFLDPSQNRIARRIRKMLAVANPLGVSDLRAGLDRMGEPLPPNEILLQFCRQLPSLHVEGDTVRASVEINVGDVLNPTERDIFNLLSERGGCMSRYELKCRSDLLGMKRPTFYQCVTSSPIVSTDNRGHYRLVGSRRPGLARTSILNRNSLHRLATASPEVTSASVKPGEPQTSSATSTMVRSLAH